MPLPTPVQYQSAWKKQFTVKTYDDLLDVEEYTRSMTLVISHPGLIWTGERETMIGWGFMLILIVLDSFPSDCV